MAEGLTYGVGGALIASYNDTGLVCMHHPPTYAHGEVLAVEEDGASITSGADWIKATKTQADFSEASANLWLFHVPGYGHIDLSLTTNNPLVTGYAGGWVYIDTVPITGIGSLRQPPSSYVPASRQIEPIWYRYHLHILLQQEYGSVGDWVQISWGLSA